MDQNELNENELSRRAEQLKISNNDTPIKSSILIETFFLTHGEGQQFKVLSYKLTDSYYLYISSVDVPCIMPNLVLSAHNKFQSSSSLSIPLTNVILTENESLTTIAESISKYLAIRTKKVIFVTCGILTSPTETGLKLTTEEKVRFLTNEIFKKLD